MIVITPVKNFLEGNYLSYLFHALHKVGYWGRIQTGISVPHLNCRDVKKITIPLPPIDLQHRFATIVESIERQKTRLRAHLSELDTLFASLQALAFNGEL